MSGSNLTYTPLTDGPVHTAADHNTFMAAVAAKMNGGLGSANMIPGGLDSTVLADAVNPQLILADLDGTFVVSGLTIATSVNLTSAVVSGAAYVSGKKQTPAGTPHTFTASKDTYVYLKDDGTYDFTSVVANNAASPAAITNTNGSRALLVAIVVTNGTAITFVNQGQAGRASGATAPVVAGAALQACDSIGNLIYPRSGQKLLAYRYVAGPLGSVGGGVFANILPTPFLAPGGRAIKATGAANFGQYGTADIRSSVMLIRNESGTDIAEGYGFVNGTSGPGNNTRPTAIDFYTPAAGLHTLNLEFFFAGNPGMSVYTAAELFIELS